MASASFPIPTLKWHKSHFLGQTKFTHKSIPQPPCANVPTAKFNLYEIMGGRGVCNGEKGLQKELEKTVQKEASPLTSVPTSSETTTDADSMSEDAFGKEFFGLTGGFPGGEKGLEKFVQQNPPTKRE